MPARTGPGRDAPPDPHRLRRALPRHDGGRTCTRDAGRGAAASPDARAGRSPHERDARGGLHPDDAAGIRSGAIQAGNLASYTKSYGLVICPVFDKNTTSTAKKVQNVVDIIFEQGDVAVSTIRK